MVDKEYQIKPNETDEQYKFRVCGIGLKNRLTWQEIADIINEVLDEDYSESKYRKEYKVAVAAYNQGVDDAKIDTEVENDYKFTEEDKKVRNKYETLTENVPYYRLMRQDSRFERFYKLVAEQIKLLDPPDYIGEVNYYENNEKEYLLGLADLHIGANFVAVNNQYSVAEAKRRFEVLLDYMKNFVCEKNITRLKILCVGDLIQNLLRISDLKLNELPVVDSFVIAIRLIADFLNKLSAYCNIDYIHVAYSNHDQIRPLGTKASELASEDLGKIAISYIRDVLVNNERVKVITDLDRDSVEFDIFGFHCKAMHGHNISNPMTVVKDLANRDRKFYDYVFLGHTHSAREIINAEGEHHNIQTLTLGSFVGSCPYADRLMVGSKASCNIYGFDKKFGHVESYVCILN